MQQSRRLTRTEKKETIPDGRRTKQKFVYEPKPIVAMTEKQAEYLRLLNDKNIRAIVCLGLHGCGKSYLSSTVAADKFRRNEIEKIIVARPYVQTGKSSGSKPGTTLEKMYPYVRNALDPIKQRLGHAAFEIALKDGQHGDIEVQELENIRGRSFDERSWLLIEEAQQTTPDEMLAIVTRVSDNCKMILSGDLNQKDIRGQSGLAWFLDFVERHRIRGVGIINFDSPDDIVRGGLVRDIAIGLMKDGRLNANN